MTQIDEPNIDDKIREMLFSWHKWRDYYYSDLKEQVITDDEWKVTRDKIDDDAIKAIKAFIATQIQEARIVTGDTSDGYHTFNELYEYRMVYNSALFNEWARQGVYDVHKSYRHSDGELCFGGGWFVVVAELPTGQVTNHYENKHWLEFDIPEKVTANKYDGHTPKEALDRIAQLRSTQ